MCDDNVFAVLIPCDRGELARTAFGLKENAPLYRRGYSDIAIEPTIDSREATPATQLSSNDDQDSSQDNYDKSDRIVLTIDKKPKNPQKGWQFGTNPQTCDVLLGHRGTHRVSGRHVRIVIRKDLQVFLYDESNYGTTVGINGQNEGFLRKRDQWIVSFEPGSSRHWKDVAITIGKLGGLEFQIHFPNHRACRPQYLKSLQVFVQECKMELPFRALGMNSETPSQPGTFNQWPYYHKRRLIGRGEFGEVDEVINTRDGTVWARKTFFRPYQVGTNSKKRKLEEEQWLNNVENEVAIMKKIDHDNVMRVKDFRTTPTPMLIMPHYPLGSLEGLVSVSEEQKVSAFRQVLIGLEHLHEHGVVHRDLKPENLLVEEPFTVVIADFGLSKVVEDQPLRTFCGTHLYAAPEVYPGVSDGYGPQVDIWSAGVIFLSLVYGLPPEPTMEILPAEIRSQTWSKRWSERLVYRVNDFEDDKLIAVLIYMARIEPQERLTTKQCLEKGCEHGLFVKCSDGRIIDCERASTPTQQPVKTTEVDARDTFARAALSQSHRANHSTKQLQEAATVDVQNVRVPR